MIPNTARARAGALALLLLALVAANAPLAAQEEDSRPPAPPPPLVNAYLTGGISLHQSPLSTSFAEVLALDGRVGLAVLPYGFEPWVGGSVAHLRPNCGAGQNCPSSEARVLGGLIYHSAFGPSGERGGAYLGAGLGTQSAGGEQSLAYSIIIGLPLGTSRRFSPIIELRAEKHEPVGDLLMISGGVRFGFGR